MRDHHGQDRPLASAAGGAPADRGGGCRAGHGLGPGECVTYSWDRERGRVVRYRWPCEQPDAACAVDYPDLDALARGGGPGGGAGDDQGRAVDPGADGAAADLDAGTVPLADAHADGHQRASADRGTIDLGDWPSLI
jgi:hypothetical protein